MAQIILSGSNQYKELERWLSDKRVLVVCGHSYKNFAKISDVIETHSDIVFFHDYSSNPKYESVVEGIKVFRKENCNAIIAIGGGSAIDVAKCIKIFNEMDISKNCLEQKIVENAIPLLVIPTTAGTGSESTRYAVIYKEGEKQSVTSDFCIPNIVLFDSDNLLTLPQYQRKATMMDVLAHALESMWSINSTEQSIEYSKAALNLFLLNKEGYLRNTRDGNKGMLQAANYAGKAINISQTTAGHAMCYKITSLFGCAHGHAAMMCNRKVFPWMIENIDNVEDIRNKEKTEKAFYTICDVLKKNDLNETVQFIQNTYDELELECPHPTNEQINILVESVNAERLHNNPVIIGKADIEMLYKEIFGLCNEN